VTEMLMERGEEDKKTKRQTTEKDAPSGVRRHWGNLGEDDEDEEEEEDGHYD